MDLVGGGTGVRGTAVRVARVAELRIGHDLCRVGGLGGGVLTVEEVVGVDGTGAGGEVAAGTVVEDRVVPEGQQPGDGGVATGPGDPGTQSALDVEGVVVELRDHPGAAAEVRDAAGEVDDGVGVVGRAGLRTAGVRAVVLADVVAHHGAVA